MSESKVRQMSKKADAPPPDPNASKEPLGQKPVSLPRCGYCGSDLGTVGIRYMGMHIPAGKASLFCRIMYCGNEECLAVIAITPAIDSVPAPNPGGQPEAPLPSIVGATHVPPVPPHLDPTRKRGA